MQGKTGWKRNYEAKVLYILGAIFPDCQKTQICKELSEFFLKK